MKQRKRKGSAFGKMLCVTGGLLVMGLIGCADQKQWKDAKLVSYNHSVSGGMNGSTWHETISALEDDVIVSESNAKWWNSDPQVTEYKVDGKILTDVEQVFKQNKMQNWEGKTFNKMMIYDAPYIQYHFVFDNGETVTFSSQAYPDPYGKSLDEISDIISSYRKEGTLLPSLVVKEKTQEERDSWYHPNHGRVEIAVYEYSANEMTIRIANGTDQPVTVKGEVKIVQNSDSKVLYEHTAGYPRTVYENSTEDKNIHLKQRLQEGMYTLYLDEYSTEFEIKLQSVE